jgi:hypothetical protein
MKTNTKRGPHSGNISLTSSPHKVVSVTSLQKWFLPVSAEKLTSGYKQNPVYFYSGAL